MKIDFLGNLEKLRELFSMTILLVVSGITLWVIDELIFVHTTLQDPLVAFIPRKPHPLGLIVYLVGTFLQITHLPFMTDFHPIMTIPKTSGPMAMMGLVDRYFLLNNYLIL